MRALNWIISLGFHGLIGIGIFFGNRFSKIELPEQTAPCNIPLDIQNFASVSRAPKSKPKSEKVREQKKSKSIAKDIEASPDQAENPPSFDEVLDHLEEKNKESEIKKKKKSSSSSKKQKKRVRKKVQKAGGAKKTFTVY
ncbi:transport protein TonB [Holospora elegans E1]|uniref:Transport protein TonB n=1 Tax=Holospora elegans E1 TaxID=1427503 RepID=A0A023E0W1_9PROT|nr:hypothetical protein [Holospora elegans]GAJ46712.1 transport protein TonB [Holospora elegans E1]